MIKNDKIQEIDTAKILSNLLSNLTSREKDVLGRRFGLSKKERETLKKIGEAHNLTRERVRQIENCGINKIKKVKEVDRSLNELKKATSDILKDHGGIIEREYLLKVLLNLFENKKKTLNENVSKNRLDFLLSKIMNEELEEIKGTENFQRSYKAKDQQVDHLEEMAEELVNKIKELRTTQKTGDLFNVLKKLNSYNKHKDKILRQSPAGISVSDIIREHYPEEDPIIIDKNKSLYSLLHATKHLDQNRFGHWGHKDWSEIKPKRINDKIYLVLKHKQKPMHFEKIAQEIDKLKFDNKKANPATIHNELILDEKYVLVGRGIYGLKEWGYKRGVVVDVIKDILEKESKALSKEEIMEKVLENRIVKKTTINLALMNKDAFIKDKEGNYRLVK
ncbi:MAG: sigma factor-like helix-turn-helix DNA-binding protein [Patescibacteria group bacterium]